MWFGDNERGTAPNGDEPSLEGEPNQKEPKLITTSLTHIAFSGNIPSMLGISSFEPTPSISLPASMQEGDSKNDSGGFSLYSLAHTNGSFSSLKATPAFPFPPTQPLDPFSHVQSRKPASFFSSRTDLELPVMTPTAIQLETAPATRTQKEFKLVNQPKEKQRKSYKKENRYLLPNPLTILYAGSSPEKVFGRVHVRLVSDTGAELEDTKANMLDGTLEKPLDAEKKAQFSLKITGTSEGCKYCLQFTIRYYIQSTQNAFQETLLSTPFKVASNKKKLLTDPPLPTGIKPAYGNCKEETEVWIKGKRFGEAANLIVKFGLYPAKIIESYENLIVCVAPAIPELLTPTEAVVTIVAKNGGEEFCDISLRYLYTVDASLSLPLQRTSHI